MDKIKNENVNINSDDIDNLSERNKNTNPPPIIIDEGVENIIVNKKESVNVRGYRNFYPWEQDNADKILAYKDITKNFGKLNLPKSALSKASPIRNRTNIIYRGTGGGGGGTTGGGRMVYTGVPEIYKSDGKPITGKSVIKRNHGTFRPSRIALNAPLVFVVGGIPIEPKQNGVLWYPGDETGREGYMWTKNKFANLTNFHVYVCKRSDNSGNGWDECTQIGKELGITFTKKILVGFSAGAGTMYSGVLARHGVGNWNVVHIVGPAISSQASCDKHLGIASGKVYYIQAGGIDKTSELADSVYKKQIAAKLPPTNVLTATGHHEGAQMSANWIAQNIKFNVEIKVTSKGTFESSDGGPGGVTVTPLSSSDLQKLRAKYKGQITEYIEKTPTPIAAPAPGGASTGRKFNTLVNGLGVVGANNKLVVSNTTRYGRVTYVGIVEGNKVLRPTAVTPKGQVGGQLNSNLLVKVDGNDYLEKKAAESFLLMQKAAAAENISISLESGYRPIGSAGTSKTGQEDWNLRRSGKQRGRTQWASWHDYKYRGGEVAAQPGNSNHGDGRAFDIKGNGVSPYNSRLTLGHQWVMLNGWKWGIYWGEAIMERWHFTFIPNIATESVPPGNIYLYDNNGNFINSPKQF
jgi:hypothetical protein